MRANWLLVTLVAILAVRCGEGRAIFNVDVYSFMKGTGRDTVRYFVPPGITVDTSTALKVNLPGAGSSLALKVSLEGTADLVNASGAGKIALQIYLAADSLGTYAASAAVLNPKPSANVFPDSTTPISFGIDSLRSASLNALFTKDVLWVRPAATVSDTSLVTMKGKAVLTSLQVTVILQDKIF